MCEAIILISLALFGLLYILGFVLEFVHNTNKDYLIKQIKQLCVNCPNYPINGGSGICDCILGVPIIY